MCVAGWVGVGVGVDMCRAGVRPAASGGRASSVHGPRDEELESYDSYHLISI